MLGLKENSLILSLLSQLPFFFFFFCLVKPFISESKKQNLILSYLSKKEELLIHKLWSNPQNDGKTKWLEWLDFGKYRTRNATGINMSIAVRSPLQDNVLQ